MERAFESRINELLREVEELKMSNLKSPATHSHLSGDFQHLLKEQVEENSKLRKEVSSKIDEIFNLRNEIEEEKAKLVVLENEIEIVKRKQKADEKNFKI